MSKLRPFIVLFNFFFITTFAGADVATVIKSQIDLFMLEREVPGVAVALYFQGQEYYYTFGLANIKEKKLVQQDTIFEIDSITKVFTSTLLATQVLSNTVTLDDRLDKIFSYLHTHSCPLGSITLKNLATHTSSLPRDTTAANTKSSLDLIKAFLSWVPSYPISSKYAYSNLGYQFLGYALGSALNKSYIDVLTQHILNPLEMSSTFIQVPSRLNHLYAQGYSESNQPAARFSTEGSGASGALRSSALDMMKFLKANLRVSGPDALKNAMQFAQKSYFPVSATLTMGLGWQRVLSNGIELVDKNGGALGFSSYIGMVPARTMGVVVLTNKFGVHTTDVGRAILKELVNAYGK